MDADTDRQKSVEPLWDTGDVADYLKVSRSTVRRYVERHGLPFLRVVGGVRYEPPAVREWAKSQPSEDAA
jgi:excisionase family DNA binding protein